MFPQVQHLAHTLLPDQQFHYDACLTRLHELRSRGIAKHILSQQVTLSRALSTLNSTRQLVGKPAVVGPDLLSHDEAHAFEAACEQQRVGFTKLAA